MALNAGILGGAKLPNGPQREAPLRCPRHRRVWTAFGSPSMSPTPWPRPGSSSPPSLALARVMDGFRCEEEEARRRPALGGGSGAPLADRTGAAPGAGAGPRA
jgi:hypothetical protein